MNAEMSYRLLGSTGEKASIIGPAFLFPVSLNAIKAVTPVNADNAAALTTVPPLLLVLNKSN
jgi:hypothetical protein